MAYFYWNTGTHFLKLFFQKRCIGLFATLFMIHSAYGFETQYQELSSREGALLPVLTIQPENPEAVVILFSGGKGEIDLLPSKHILKDTNFLIRSRELFAKQNLLVAILDIPSDRQEDGLLYGFRESKEHIQDIRTVIQHISQLTDKPIWLVGTSRGSSSAIAGAIQLKDSISGIVISAPMTDENARGLDVPSMPLKKVTLPVYIAHHKKDPCDFTRPAGSKQIAKSLKNASTVKLELFEGGYQQEGARDCGAMTHHGFLGIEETVVKAITTFIKTYSF